MTYICTFYIDTLAPKQEASSSKKIKLHDYLNINLVYSQKNNTDCRRGLGYLSSKILIIQQLIIAKTNRLPCLHNILWISEDKI